MYNKTAILKKLLPNAVLEPLTPEMEDAIPAVQKLVRIDRFPFKIGRECRVREIEGKLIILEREKSSSILPNNDLFLIDGGELLQISREHLQIEADHDGYYLIDRGSARGSAAGEHRIGGKDQGGRCKLNDGDIIAIGGVKTPYLLRFITFLEADFPS